MKSYHTLGHASKQFVSILQIDFRRHSFTKAVKPRPLFVFSINGPKQNARSLLTPVAGTVFYAALSHGSLGFALHGSFFNHLLIG